MKTFCILPSLLYDQSTKNSDCFFCSNKRNYQKYLTIQELRVLDYNALMQICRIICGEIILTTLRQRVIHVIKMHTND